MPKRAKPLSAIALAKLKPDAARTIELPDGAVPGLRMRLSPAGTRSWSLNVRAKGVMRRFDVGTGLGLHEARKAAEVLKSQIREGVDPTAERRAEREKELAAKQGIGTFGSILATYFEDGPGAGLRTGKEQRRQIESVFERFLKRPAVELRPEELQLVIDKYPARGSAAHATAYLSPVSKWAVKRGYFAVRFELEKPILGLPKQRVLTEQELARLFPFFVGPYGLCCRLILLTAVRRNEARYATWRQFDMDAAMWTIPGDLRKDTRGQGRRRQHMKEALAVPLSRQAMELLNSARQLEIDRRARLKIAQPIDDDDYVFYGSQGGTLEKWQRWLKIKIEESEVGDWSPHALRRTSATLIGELGFAPHVVSVVLGHSNIGGYLVSGYNKSKYVAEHSDALQKLADKLDLLTIDSKHLNDWPSDQKICEPL